MEGRQRKDQKYQQIAASLRAVGLIEPLIVFPTGRGKYRILDGNKRFDILTQGNATEVECLLATEDESYTYNKRANYLSSVGEHSMIIRALAHNSIERIAQALNVNVDTIRRKRNLLDGICTEAIELLKERRVPPKTFGALRKMKPVRQVETAELMIASNMYSARFAAALLAGTSAQMLVESTKNGVPVKPSGVPNSRMENETDALLKNLKTVEESYGVEVLTLSVSCRYLAQLLANIKVHRYIAEHFPEICRELEELATQPIPARKLAV